MKGNPVTIVQSIRAGWYSRVVTDLDAPENADYAAAFYRGPDNVDEITPDRACKRLLSIFKTIGRVVDDGNGGSDWVTDDVETEHFLDASPAAVVAICRDLDLSFSEVGTGTGARLMDGSQLVNFETDQRFEIHAEISGYSDLTAEIIADYVDDWQTAVDNTHIRKQVARMRITNGNGDVVGHILGDPSDAIAINNAVDARMSELLAAQRARLGYMSAPSDWDDYGRVGPRRPDNAGPAPEWHSGIRQSRTPYHVETRGMRADSEIKRYLSSWKVIALAFGALAVGLLLIGGNAENTAENNATPSTTVIRDSSGVADLPTRSNALPADVAPSTDIPRATVRPNGDVLLGANAIDNVRELSSPIRARFARDLTAAGVPTGDTGVKNGSLDASLTQAVDYCRAIANGELVALRELSDATTDSDYGTGRVRVAIVLAAVDNVCPEYR